MTRNTYGDVKSGLARVCGPSGLAPADPRVLEFTNLAIGELWNAGNWAGVVDRFAFYVYDRHLILPEELDVALAVTSNRVPVQVENGWYDFLAYGPGEQDDDCKWTTNLIDRGVVSTVREIPNEVGKTYQIRVDAETDERVDGVRPFIIFRGFDNNGLRIRSLNSAGKFIDGLEVEIDGDSNSPRRVVTSMLFSHLESALKPATNGAIHIWADDGTDAFSLSSYAPRETRPAYRRYFLPFLNIDKEQTITVQARRRFLPVVEDDDFLPISNVSAVRMMIRGLVKQGTDDLQGYHDYRISAINLMREETNVLVSSNKRVRFVLSTELENHDSSDIR